MYPNFENRSLSYATFPEVVIWSLLCMGLRGPHYLTILWYIVQTWNIFQILRKGILMSNDLDVSSKKTPKYFHCAGVATRASTICLRKSASLARSMGQAFSNLAWGITNSKAPFLRAAWKNLLNKPGIGCLYPSVQMDTSIAIFSLTFLLCSSDVRRPISKESRLCSSHR